MFLKRVAIINYRSCQNLLLEFAPDKPSIYIGTNDSGKSAILRAIGLLLDGKMPFNSSKDGQVTSDISNTSITEEAYSQVFQKFNLPIFPYSPTQTVLLGDFEIQEGDISEEFKSDSSNQLQWSIESNGNRISLLKVFNNVNPVGAYYLCCGDTTPQKELWKQTQTVLKKLVADLNIPDEEERRKCGRPF